MNNVILVGRLTNNPEVRYVGNSQTPVSEFTLAVDRKYKNQEGIRKTDFIRVEIWDRKAEICCQYFRKGSLIGIEGSLRVDNYKTSMGEFRSVVKVRANNFNFITSKNKSQSKYQENNKQSYEGLELFDDIAESVEISDEEIPF